MYVSAGTTVRVRFGGMLSTGTASASEKKTTFREYRTRAVPVGVAPLRSPGLVSGHDVKYTEDLSSLINTYRRIDTIL